MRLLYVIPYTPTIIRIRPYNLVHRLVEHGHHVTVACVWESPEEYNTLLQYRANGMRVISAHLSRARSVWNSLRALPGGLPLQAEYSWQPSLLKLIEQEQNSSCGGYDVVHVEHLRGARFGLAIKRRLSATPLVWDSVDCISGLFKQAAVRSANAIGRWIARFELVRTQGYEPFLTTQFNRTLVVSQLEQAAFEALLSRLPTSTDKRIERRIQVLPNGVDTDYLKPQVGPRESATIVFTGKLSYHANSTAALFLIEQVMPRIWARRPQVRVQIVGQKPPRRVMNLVNQFPGRVQVTGYVPDMRTYLARATLAVAPIVYGAGIQNKVLEAMAMGTPVVATRQATAALAVEDGRDLLVGDNVQELSQHILCLIDNPTRRDQLGANGRRYVLRHHNWDVITTELESIYQEVIEDPTVG